MDKILVLDSEMPAAKVFEAFRISPEGYEAYWPYIEKELDRVPHIWRSHWTKEALYAGGMSGMFQVWGFGLPEAISLIVYTQIAEFPAARILQAFLAFGNSLEEALPIITATFERFAQEANCGCFEVVGRKGWARKLSGYREERVVLRYDVSRYGVH